MSRDRASGAASLASLEYLQNQRRGSITDPVLHVHSYRRDDVPRPSSPYVFGNASPEPASQLRKLLHSPAPGPGPPRPSPRDPASFDFTMRRHSIAVGQNAITLPHLGSTLHGTKRKMSGDRSLFPPLGEDGDGHLAGPGVPSGMDMDADAPAPKRRGSTVDTQRIAQLSLTDRRSSVDTRSWDRRESAPSLFPGISSFNAPPSDSLSRPPPSLAAFSWSANTSDTHTPSSNESPHSRHFDQLNLVPPINYSSDRRMSVPDAHSSSRDINPRSRPPSRQATGPNDSAPSSGQDEPSNTLKLKESTMTPYSRSPELRVSHKLAERKRRKEMKELFDELRDQLPADRGMKASKWEILSKAIDFVAQLKRSHQEMAQELDILRAQVHNQRPEGLPAFPAPSAPSHAPYGANSILPSYPAQPTHQTPPTVPTPASDARSPPLFSKSVNSSPQNTNGRRVDATPS